MPDKDWLQETTPAFRLMIATSWLAPDSWMRNQEEAIREAIEAGTDWTEYVRLVDRHRIPALSWAALRRVPGVEIPEPAKRELEKRSDASRMQAVEHSLLLAEVLRELNRSGIPVMSVKGVILSYELYGDVGLRQSRDLDLGVAQEDLAGAQVCLEKLGWRLDPSKWFSLSPRQWKSFLSHEHDLHFVHSATGRFLELQWRNQWDSPDQTAECWARSIPTTWQGCSYQARSPIDLALYLANHGGEHLWFRAKWLGDLASVHASHLVDWAQVFDEARRTGQERVMLASLRLLERVYGLPLPDLPKDSWIELPSVLTEKPLQAVRDIEELLPRDTSPASLRDRIVMSRYERLLRPRRTWRDSFTQFLYSREDFRKISLPDRLFWAYVPLRPVQWFLRWARNSGRRSAKRTNSNPRSEVTGMPERGPKNIT